VRRRVSAALFAVYHLWQPYNWPSIFCFTLPMIWAVARFKGVRLAIAIHVLMNLLGFVTFAALVLRG
jgi:membrane protease YdiL (CAAX protease family)